MDRFLVSAEWDMAFPFLKGVARPRPVSDHVALVLCGKMPSGAPRPFKFEIMWLQYLDFNGLVKAWWDSFVVVGRLGQRLKS